MTTLNVDALIYVSVEKIQQILDDFMAQENLAASAVTAINDTLHFVISSLEAQALIARASGKRLILDGGLSVEEAEQRAVELRGLIRF